jgi:hypothetical protein
MKKIISILALFALAAFVFQACDKIEEPYLRNSGGHEPGDTTVIAVRKVLLEDYTGHKCVNCPGAGFVAHDLKEQYEEQLVVVAVHAGFFAQPNSSGLYTADFRTDAGNEYFDFFQIIANPNGMVNRVGEGQDRVLGETQWPSAVGAEVAKEPVSTIEITGDYNEGTKVLSTSLTIKFLSNLPGKYRVCAMITEDSIIAPQMNNDPSIGPSPDWEDFVHMHMLRGNINGTWGNSITDETIISGAEYTVECANYAFSDTWDDQHCNIVAFVFNEETFEVIQAEEVKLIE